MMSPKNIYVFLALSVLTIAVDLPNKVIPSRYKNTKGMDSTLTMYWNIDDVAGEIEIALEGKCEGWVGIGFSRGTGMLNSDVIIGWVSNGVAQVFDYEIGSSRGFSCPNGVCLDTTKNGQNNVLAFNGSEASGVTSIIFTRKLNTGDSLDVILTNGNQLTIYGWTDFNDGPTLAQHSRTPVAVGINYFTGKVTKKTDLKLIHGSLMFIAWFLIAPVGFILARFLKEYTWWFNAHRILMWIAMAAQVAAFGVIVAEVPAGYHFDNAHKIIGLIVFIIGVAQPIIGILADKFFNPDRKAIPIFPDKTHWVLGWISITLGMINIILGLLLYPTTDKGVLVAYCVCAAFLFAGCVGFAVFRLIRPVKGH